MRAQAADGSIHEFPDGTDIAVVDRVMKGYAAQAQPQFSEKQADQLQKDMPLPTMAERSMQSSPITPLLQGARDTINGPAELLPHALGALTSLGGTHPNPVSDWLNEQGKKTVEDDVWQARRYDAAREVTQPAWMPDVGRVGANIAGGVGLSALTGLPSGAPTTLGRIGQGMLSGSFQGLMAPATSDKDSYWGQKAKQVAIGAGTGAAVPAVTESVARFISPRNSAEVQKLLDEGVRLTPGQMAGGAAQVLEDKAQSLPIMGDAIRGARQRGMEDMNQAAYNRALGPIGQTLPKDQLGRDAAQHTADELGAAYNKLLSGVNGAVDQQFLQDVRGVIQSAAGDLPDQQQKALENIITTQFGPKKLPYGKFTGETLKGIDEEIGKQAKGYAGDQSFDNRKLGQYLTTVKTAVRDMLGRVGGPDVAKRLNDIDTGYANYVRLRDASSRLGAKEGVFTPAQLAGGVRAADKSVGKGAYSRGTALMQDLSDAANKVLPSQYPDSGTVGRAMLGVGALGAGAIHPGIPLGLTAGAIPYTTQGQRLSQYLMASPKLGATSRPVAGAIGAAGVPAGNVAAILARLLIAPQALQ